MRWSLSPAILFTALLAASLAPPGAGAQDLGLDADLDLVVEMPLAVADAFDAGVPADDLALLARALVEGAVAPADFIEVVTLAPLAYEGELVEASHRPARDGRNDVEGDRRRGPNGPGIGAYVQRQLDRGLRGPELSRAIHRELHRRGIPAGPPGRKVGVRGGDRVALDLSDLRELRDRRDRRLARDRDLDRDGERKDRIDRRLTRDRGRDRVPPGQLKKGEEGRGKPVPPGHAKGRGRGHDKGKGKGHGPPPHARGGQGGGPGSDKGSGNGGGR